MHRSFLKKIVKIASLGLFVLSGFFLAGRVSADTIFFSPSQANYSVGKTFSVQVLVSSPAVSVNAVSGTISFPPEKIQVVSISKTDSIVSLWVQDPSFSNAQGTVNFEGVILNPGFKGSNAKAITINFKVIGAGVANLSLSSASLLANDGSGTNILRNVGSASFNNVSLAPVPTTAVEPVADSKNPAPLISSDAFPDQKKWYTATAGTFSWDVPSDATETLVLFDKSRTSVPTKSYKPAISSKVIEDIENGIWYLHVRHKTKSGDTGIAHYRVNVDTTAPSNVTIRDVSNPEKASSKADLSISAVDGDSAISRYKISIDGADGINWQDPGDGIYTTPILEPGQHNIVVRAYDEAGNSSSASTDITVRGLSAPVITSYPKKISSTEAIIVRGTAEPGSEVRLFVVVDGEPNQINSTTTDSQGNFNIVLDPSERLSDGAATALFDQVAFKAGFYKFWVDSIDENESRSYPSDSVGITITRSVLERFGQNFSDVMSIVFPVVATIGLLVILSFIAVRKFYALKSVVRKETKQSESLIHKSFNLLREDMAEYMRLLERAKSRRKLTEEEDAIINRLYDDIEGAERVIKKEVEKIEEDVE